MLQCFYNAKNVFLAVNASLCWLNNVSGVYFVQVSLLLIGLRGLGTFLQASALASFGLEDCANFTPTPGENDQLSRQLLLVQFKQQANPLLSMHNYTPFVISGNDENIIKGTQA